VEFEVWGKTMFGGKAKFRSSSRLFTTAGSFESTMTYLRRLVEAEFPKFALT
jgi:hypothetical protein